MWVYVLVTVFGGCLGFLLTLLWAWWMDTESANRLLLLNMLQRHGYPYPIARRIVYGDLQTVQSRLSYGLDWTSQIH